MRTQQLTRASGGSRAAWTCALAAGAAILLAGCGGDGDSDRASQPSITGPLPASGSNLFVLRGPAFVSGGRIEVDTGAVEWFNDRPQRKAGVAAADELIESWEDYGFIAEPPNAALAGDEIDAEVELTKPEATANGLSFAFAPIRGEVPDGEDESVSIFLDSSSWKTDMHVYVKAVKGEGGQSNLVGWCSQSDQTVLADPVINSPPANWSYQPIASITLTESNQEIFTAASKSGTTSFSVTYDVKCQSGASLTQVGQVKFSGKVPDNLNPDEFSCAGENMVKSSVSQYLGCASGGVSGYHVDAYAVLEYNTDSVNGQITD